MPTNRIATAGRSQAIACCFFKIVKRQGALQPFHSVTVWWWCAILIPLVPFIHARLPFFLPYTHSFISPSTIDDALTLSYHRYVSFMLNTEQSTTPPFPCFFCYCTLHDLARVDEWRHRLIRQYPSRSYPSSYCPSCCCTLRTLFNTVLALNSL